MEPPDFPTALANIRRLTASKLAHQAKPAQLLTAIEATLATALPNEQGPPFSSTAYFASLVGCLSKACAPGNKDADDFSDGGLVPAALYLLAAVAPETPRQVIVNQQQTLVPLLVALFDKSLAHPPALRSLITVVTVVLTATPAAGLNGSPLLKRAWNHLLELNLDSRPKVRHLAQEGVRRTLSTPVPPKLIAGDHPYLPRARDWVAGVLNEEAKGGASQAQAKKVKFAGVKGAVMQGSEDMEGKRAIWVIQGLRGWVNVWGEEHLSDLCTLLLSLPPLPHLTPQIYSLLALLLSPSPAKDADTPVMIPSQLPNLPVILNALISSPPHSSAPQDQIEYITALSSGMIKLSMQDAYLSANEYFSKAWTTLWSSILIAPSTAPEARRQAVQGLGSQGLIKFCISDEMIDRALEYKIQGGDLEAKRQKMKPPLLTKIINQLEKAMTTQPLLLQYLLPILTALISRLRYRPATASANAPSRSKRDAAAYILIKDLIVEIADLRSQPSFEHKEKVDDVIGMAFEVVGVEAVLDSLPLNIEPDASGKPPQPGRAHLLPIMRERITNDSVAYFVNTLVPLSQRLFDRKIKATEGGRAAEAKVWEVLIGQIWDCLPGFLDLARDLREGFTAPFAQLLSQLLYTQPLLRPPILRALSTLVTSMQTLSSSGATSEELLANFGVDQQEAAQSVAYLKGFAGEMLAVLFNVFSSVAREQRGMVGDVIGQWLSIMTEKDVTETYNKVTGMLATALTSPSKQQDSSLPPVSHTMLDLLIILIPHLPPSTAVSLFNAASTGNLIENNDAAIQKKCYRILTKLIESGKVASALQGESVDEFVNKLADLSANVGVGAQRDRMLLLTSLVPKLPQDRLHVVLVLVTEAVLGTKEVSEKARNAAYDLLVALGNKMAEGGTISQSLMAGSNDVAQNDEKTEGEADGDDAEMQPAADVTASIEEYIKIVAAGMVGTTPHMISATITALSRLIFEFQDDISRQTMDDLLETVVVFLEAKNREIVKSALGFVKVAVVSLPADSTRGHLKRLVPALLNWVHDHKNHFKLKTVHIFERMIRKYGYDDVYKCAPEGNERKVLEHIKKKKDRAKRQKAVKATDGAGDEEPTRKQSTGSAFEDALYGSASEEESDGEAPAPAKANAKNAKVARRDKQNAAYLREDEDAPMDLLDRSIAGKITTSDPSAKKRRRPGQDASAFKVDEDTGRMVIDESASETEQQEKPSAGDMVAGSAYQTAMTSVDGMRRDDKGRLKFNKNTKRARALEAENDTDVLQDIMAEEPPKKKKAKKEVEKLGSEFRSKRAGGDVKRDGQADPFSYVPLSKATKQKNPNSRVSLTNKKKGSRRG